MTGANGQAKAAERANSVANLDSENLSGSEGTESSVNRVKPVASMGSSSLETSKASISQEFYDLETRVGPGRFVERQTYRRRRLADSARAIPVLGMLLWFVPLLWAGNDDGVRATHALIYIFVVWIGLVVLSVGILAALRRAERRSAEERRAMVVPQGQPFARNPSPLNTRPTIGSDTQVERSR